MDSTSFASCPRCGSTFQDGFAGRISGISFVSPEKFDHFAFVDEDISKAGFRKYLPWKAEYYRSYLCRACQLYVIDYSVIYNRNEAEQLIKSTNGTE